MLINRDAYLNKLIERQNNGMVKVITGIRRCGKSFLLFKLYKEYLLNNGVTADHIIEIALDGIDVDELRNPKVCFSYIKEKIIDDEMYFVLLDEVQFMDRFEEVLNSLLRIENVDVYVTGSNSKFLSKDIITLPVIIIFSRCIITYNKIIISNITYIKLYIKVINCFFTF